MHNHPPASRNPFRVIKRLLLGYLGVGVAALVAVILLRNHPAEVNGPAWARSIIVVATALILLSAATLAGRGVAVLANSRGARARFATGSPARQAEGSAR
jgi:hypothetical protein